MGPDHHYQVTEQGGWGSSNDSPKATASKSRAYRAYTKVLSLEIISHAASPPRFSLQCGVVTGALASGAQSPARLVNDYHLLQFT